MASVPDAPYSDIDLWADEALNDPYPLFRDMRDLGSVVWMEKLGCWGAFRFKVVREILGTPQVFSSARGVMLNDGMNKVTSEAGVILCTDDPIHRTLRKVFQRPLTPGAVAKLHERLAQIMDAQVEKLLEMKSFDAVPHIAQILPLAVVTELVGLNEEGKTNMLNWAAAVFNAFGPDHATRTRASMELVGAVFAYVGSVSRETLDPHGWGATLFKSVDEGEISEPDARAMLADYLVPALDTTISALSSAVLLFGQNPDQWSLLRQDLGLIPGAIEEVVRFYSPIRGFARVAMTDYEVDGVNIRAGDRVQVFYASANRDERHYPDPDKFLITRRPKDHVGFGYGHHLCAGMHLAKLEITTALQSLAPRVASFRVESFSRPLHNTLTVMDRLQVTIEAA